MRLSPRPKSTSTCPLCRAEVARSQGITCETCGSISHPACVQELGPCHGSAARGESADPIRRAAERLANHEALNEHRESARRTRRERWRESLDTQREEEDTRAGQLEEWNQTAAWILGIFLAVGCVATVVTWGFEAGFAFAFQAGLMSVGLAQVWGGITTGKISTIEEHSSEEFRFKDQPLRYLIAKIAWGGMALLFGGLAGRTLLLGLG